jgi:hypothetical protein
MVSAYRRIGVSAYRRIGGGSLVPLVLLVYPTDSRTRPEVAPLNT